MQATIKYRRMPELQILETMLPESFFTRYPFLTMHMLGTKIKEHEKGL